MIESTKISPQQKLYHELLKRDFAIEKKLCEKYSFFLKSAWEILEPTTPLIWNWHYDVLCEELELQIRRIAARKVKEYDIIINVPPRSGKSTIGSRFLLPWTWTLYPGIRFITASYSSKLSLDHAVDSRTVINSPWYQRHWGECYELTGDQNTKSNYRNSESGYRIATSVGGSGTGSGGQIAVLDDPLDRSLGASSIATREEANRWFKQTWYGCLNNKSIDIRIVIMQRVHEEDTTGYLRKYFPGDYKLFCFPGELTEDVSPPEYKAKYIDGLFFKGNFSRAILDGYKKTLGSDYAGQILQRPTAPEGNKFKRYWFKFWRPKGSNLPAVQMKIGTDNHVCESRDLPDDLGDYITSWDMGLKPRTENDPSCGDVFARNQADVFWLDEDWGHYDPFEKEEHVINQRKKYPQTSISIIEDETGGSETIIRLKKKYSRILGITPHGSKWSRADNAAALARAGNLWLPHPAIFPQVWDIIDELCTFDRAVHDERVDTLSQAINYYNIMQRVWSEYEGKMYNFKTLWEAIERDTQPIITHWVEKNLTYSALISLWNSRTKVLWIIAEYQSNNSMASMIVKSLTSILKLVFRDNKDAWDLNRYLHFGSPLMFTKATGDVAEGFQKEGLAINQVRYDERGSILRIANLFYNKNIIIHARCIDMHDKIISWSMDDNTKNPEPEREGYGICRSLCLTASAIWESGFVKAAPKDRKPYQPEKKPRASGINDWMKVV